MTRVGRMSCGSDAWDTGFSLPGAEEPGPGLMGGLTLCAPAPTARCKPGSLPSLNCPPECRPYSSVCLSIRRFGLQQDLRESSTLLPLPAMAAPRILMLAAMLACMGLAAAAGQTCTKFNPVKYNAKSHTFTVDPFNYPATLPGFPFPPCAFAVKGYETKDIDLAGNHIMNAKCSDRIRFVIRHIANVTIIKPATAENHGVYVLHNVKNESSPCPKAAECGTKEKGSVPCSKLGWGERIMPLITIDRTHARLSKPMKAYVKFDKKSTATSTTLWFGCPEYVDLGPGAPKFSHCQIGMILKVVVQHPPGGCK